MQLKRRIIIALILVIAMLFTQTAAFAGTSVSEFDGKTYTHNERFKDDLIISGIDVSVFQGDVDWQEVKASGVDFAIIKIGGTYYSKNYAENELVTYYDDNFEKNIKGAKDAGLMVGVYFFSQAMNVYEAQIEAGTVITKIKDYDLDLPVFMDYEYERNQNYRIEKLTKEGRTNNAKVFCRTIENAGYEAGLYSYLDFLESDIDGAAIGKEYFTWVARYNTSCSYQGNYSMWQYTDKGAIEDAFPKGSLIDCNFWYLDRNPKATSQKSMVNCQIEVDSAVYSPSGSYKPAVRVYDQGNLLTEGTDYKVNYINNRDKGVSYAYVVGMGEYKDYQLKSFDIKNKPLASKRLAGDNRYLTGIEVLKELYKENNYRKFDSVIVADGGNYADALAGSYLSKVKSAPILLVDDSKSDIVMNAIKSYVNSGSTVYILGGTGAVSDSVANKILDSGYVPKRLGGETRFDTNLEILREAGVNGQPIMVCDAFSFADSLSASAVGNPILLVGDSLTADQIKFLSENPGMRYVIGGTGAVSANVGNQLGGERIEGENRYETSLAIANKFFTAETDNVLIASGNDFPDGLTGSFLAMKNNAPLLLVNDYHWDKSKQFIDNSATDDIIIVGGSGVVSDFVVNSLTKR